MVKIDLLLVGDATDGPVEEIVRIDSLEEAFRTFGGYRFEETTLASGSTGYTLNTAPWANEVLPLRRDSDGFLIPHRLFEFQADGTALSWTSPGASAQVVFRYPVEPGSTSLLKGIAAARRTGLTVHAVRLGGTPAQVTAGGFTFYSRYAGSRYNGITLTITSGGAVTIAASGDVARPRTYQLSSDQALFETLRDEVQRGFQAVMVTGPFSRTSFTVAAGTYSLTGGTDGTLDADKFKDFVTEWDLAGVDVVCPVGLLTTEISGNGTLTVVAENDYPTLVVAQAPPSGVALSGILNDERHLVSVGFKVRYDFGLPKERLDDAAPLVAAIIGGNIFGITLAALPESPAEPKYDQPGLHAVTSGGHHLVAFRSISKDWALWHADTGEDGWPVSQFRCLQEIARVIFETLDPVIGNALLDKDELDELLAEGFSSVTGSRIVDWELNLQGDTLYCDVSFTPFGEIRIVKAQITLGTARDINPV